MSAVGDRPDVAERYERATESGDLSILDTRTDADLLLAAGYAAAGNERGRHALTLYRAKATGQRAGLQELVQTFSGWVLARSRHGGRDQLRRWHADAIALAVLAWWLDGVCAACEGRRYDLVPGTRVISDNLCQHCAGAGKMPVETQLRWAWREPGRWLATEIDELLSDVIADMAMRLRPALDLELVPLNGAIEALQARLEDLRSAESQRD